MNTPQQEIELALAQKIVEEAVKPLKEDYTIRNEISSIWVYIPVQFPVTKDPEEKTLICSIDCAEGHIIVVPSSREKPKLFPLADPQLLQKMTKIIETLTAEKIALWKPPTS